MNRHRFHTFFPTLQQDIQKFIFCEQMLTKNQCDEIVHEAKKETFERSPTDTIGWTISFESVRLKMTNKFCALLDQKWQEIISHFNFSIDFTEDYEIKRYKQNDFITPHIDTFFNTEKNRKLTMICQLSNSMDYEGGDLVLFDALNMPREKGMIIVFPSYFTHEIKRIESGTRYSLNSWAWGPQWQ